MDIFTVSAASHHRYHNCFMVQNLSLSSLVSGFWLAGIQMKLFLCRTFIKPLCCSSSESWLLSWVLALPCLDPKHLRFLYVLYQLSPLML